MRRVSVVMISPRGVAWAALAWLQLLVIIPHGGAIRVGKEAAAALSDNDATENSSSSSSSSSSSADAARVRRQRRQRKLLVEPVDATTVGWHPNDATTVGWHPNHDVDINNNNNNNDDGAAAIANAIGEKATQAPSSPKGKRRRRGGARGGGGRGVVDLGPTMWRELCARSNPKDSAIDYRFIQNEEVLGAFKAAAWGGVLPHPTSSRLVHSSRLIMS